MMGRSGGSWEDKLNDLPNPKGAETLGIFLFMGRWEDISLSQKIESNKQGHTPLVYKARELGKHLPIVPNGRNRSVCNELGMGRCIFPSSHPPQPSAPLRHCACGASSHHTGSI